MFINITCIFNLIFLFRNKINIKEAIDYIAEAWENVTQSTIRNCWVKTGILPSSDYILDEIDMEEEDFELEDLDEINIDDLPEEEVDDLYEYFQTFDNDIPTEEHLTDEQIINLVQIEEGDDESDISDEELSVVTDKEGAEALKTFISYFQQQNGEEFNVNDLYVFRKYLRIVRAKEFNSKEQTSLDMFF